MSWTGWASTWTDPLGASNNKWSYENLALDIHHEAHVEDVENGTHLIAIGNQTGCTSGPSTSPARNCRTRPADSISLGRSELAGGYDLVDVM